MPENEIPPVIREDYYCWGFAFPLKNVSSLIILKKAYLLLIIIKKNNEKHLQNDMHPKS